MVAGFAAVVIRMPGPHVKNIDTPQEITLFHIIQEVLTRAF
jgi:hypothetical protein